MFAPLCQYKNIHPSSIFSVAPLSFKLLLTNLNYWLTVLHKMKSYIVVKWLSPVGLAGCRFNPLPLKINIDALAG